MGERCGVDATSNGSYPKITQLASLPNVKPVGFCPENFAFGTPRKTPDIHDGNGFDVLRGTARVLSENGDDWTKGMLDAAYEMLRIAKAANVRLAITMDMSAACPETLLTRFNFTNRCCR